VKFEALKALLEKEVKIRNCVDEISMQKPDPLLIATRYKDEYIALMCALFSYGDARAIVKFLESLDFSLLDKESSVEEALQNNYYRFQNTKDIQEFFLTCRKAKAQNMTLESIFYEGYKKHHSVIDGIRVAIEFLYDMNPYRSFGYGFLLGKIPTSKPTSPYKRWNMFLRWMVRSDVLDMGLWKSVHTKDLLMPLDTHTFSLGKKLGLIKRKSYDFKAVLELTESLRKMDKNDPVKFDFALYRLGQENQILSTK
jgi:uncharacterized protein (TIGR02757 family)